MQDVFIVSATRTAIGSFGGSLKETSPIDLGTHIAKAAIEKSGVAADAIDHAVIGNVIHTEPRDMYISRCISIGAGMREGAPALTVNRLLRQRLAGDCQRHPDDHARRCQHRACRWC